MDSNARIRRVRKTISQLPNKILFAVSLLAMMACSDAGVYYSDFRNVGSGWTKDRLLRYELPDSLPDGKSSLFVSIRHTNYYPYRNLWIVADYVRGGRVVESDTCNIQLADMFGNWFGSGLGQLYQYSVAMRDNVGVDGFEEVILWHYMRCDTVTGIEDVGLSLSLDEE